MQIKLSKILRKYLDLGCREAAQRGNVELAPEMAFLSIIKEQLSHATHILARELKDWELYQIRVRLEREMPKNQPTRSEQEVSAEAEQMLAYLIYELQKSYPQTTPDNKGIGEQEQIINTGYFLIWLLRSRKYVCSRLLELYAISEYKIVEELNLLPTNEDYYTYINALGRLARLDMEKKLTIKNIEDISDLEAEDSQDAQSWDENSIEQDDILSQDSLFTEDTPTERISAAIREYATARSNSLIEQFGVNLNEKALNGEIDPVIGRDAEIERMIQILGRRKKNNPILIGEAGVGKSAVVEGLALRLVEGNVPHSLIGKQILSLDIASLVAGTKYRGEFEQRIKNFIKELGNSRDTIVFIDELHTIVGAGSTSGSLDIANILKPALARGEIQCIGATTLDEYREDIESDGALDRRFQKIIIHPTTKEQTLTILHSLKEHYQAHHLVEYTDDALRAAVELSERYITERNLPDKAIDAMDEAGSRAHLNEIQEPEVIAKLLEELVQAEQRYADTFSDDTASGVELQSQISSLRQTITKTKDEWYKKLERHPIVVDTEQIEEVISVMSGVPVESAAQTERQRLQKMDKQLAKRVIGQPGAVDKVTRSIQRSRTGLKDPNRPIGVFMFVGPTGVGKTHLAKELSQWIFGTTDSVIRIDMSEYAEKHNVSRMVGSPPGYVGYNEGGQLTEAVRRQPYSVILLDEIEKAHPDVCNIMLQIFDQGQLTDGNGRKVDFRNTIIIMTSNAGSQAIQQRPAAVGFNTAGSTDMQTRNIENEYQAALEQSFTPEFLNRIDDIIVFNHLTLKNIRQIVGLELRELLERASTLGYKIEVTPQARQQLALLGYEPQYGARSLKRTILERVEEPLAELIVNGKIGHGDSVMIRSREQQIELVRQ